jgi:signal transduction histidine kinase
VRGVTRFDVAVSATFVLASVLEAVVVHRDTPGLMVFNLGSAPVLAVLAVRRTRPLVTVCVLAGFGVFGTIVQAAVWPEAASSGGVWLFAMILGCYSLGAHARGPAVALGGVAPLVVVLAADLPTMSGWGLASGVLFVTAFIGVLPTAVGRLVRVRRDRLAILDEQATRILRGQRAATESAVLEERLRATERLQPALIDGMRSLAEAAEEGVEPGLIETAARDLLAHARAEVVALTAPVETCSMTVGTEAPDHVRALRDAAQPWAVIAGGAVAAGLALESIETLPLTRPDWVAVLAALAVGAPLALVWWRPVAAVAAGWAAAAVFSHVVAPLDGALSESAFALCSAFAVGALSRRRAAAVAGLLVCWLGQGLVGTDGPVGEAAIVLVCWLGGLALNEVTRVVEQGHAYHRLLAEQEAAAAQRAVVDERLRLAREIHDQIGHSLTVVALQAGAARRLASSDPDRTRSLLLTIATAARDGLAALDGAENAGDLDSLLDVTRTAGLPVDADVGDWASLDPARRAVVHRLVQEALTNALRHAPGATARVSVHSAVDGVTVTIANSAPAHAGGGPGTGRGLVGIRERVTTHAGRVQWGPRPDGGFEVHAVLPAVLEEAVP